MDLSSRERTNIWVSMCPPLLNGLPGCAASPAVRDWLSSCADRGGVHRRPLRPAAGGTDRSRALAAFAYDGAAAARLAGETRRKVRRGLAMIPC